jgi:hypothetical protein
VARKLIVEIVGDASSLERAFKKSSKSANRFESNMAKTQTKSRRAFAGMGRSVLGFAGSFVGAYGLVSAARAAFSEMAEAQKVTAQTNAVIKSTGKAANVSAKHVDDLATSLLNVSGVDDEVIKAGENMLLTFRDIRNESGEGNKIFDEATKATLDLSVAMGRDMTQSAIMVGKALNDPVKGVGALRRVGVQFTKAQEDQIKALVATGDKMGAQKLILEELRKEFGGSAEAAGKTLPGKLNILRNTLLNLAGSIAALLTPTITKLVDKMVVWLSKSKNQKQVLDTVKAAAEAVESVARVLVGTFKALNAITGSTKNTFKLLLGLFIAFKALRLVRYIAGMAAAMKAFAGWSAAASTAGAGGGLGKGGKGGKLGRLGRIAGAGLRFAGPVGAGIAVGQIAKATLPRSIRGPRLTDVLGITGRDKRPVQVNVQVDGRTIARATARHNEDALARRRKQRAHQRRSTR